MNPSGTAAPFRQSRRSVRHVSQQHSELADSVEFRRMGPEVGEV